MRRTILFLIALSVVLIIAQTARADGYKQDKSWFKHWKGLDLTLEVVVGQIECNSINNMSVVNAYLSGTSGILQASGFEALSCRGESSATCTEFINPIMTILQEQGCAIGKVDDVDPNSSYFEFVCKGPRNKEVCLIAGLCSFLITASQSQDQSQDQSP